MSREEALKKKRCQKIRMPRERDINAKRLERHLFQETGMTSEKHCQASVSSLGLQSCQQEGAVKIRS